jgi:hypothetical protein
MIHAHEVGPRGRDWLDDLKPVAGADARGVRDVNGRGAGGDVPIGEPRCRTKRVLVVLALNGNREMRRARELEHGGIRPDSGSAAQHHTRRMNSQRTHQMVLSGRELDRTPIPALVGSQPCHLIERRLNGGRVIGRARGRYLHARFYLRQRNSTPAIPR